MRLKLEALESEAFAGYGEVLERGGGEERLINNGSCVRHHDLSRVDCVGSGQASLSLFSARPCELPYRLVRFERHPLGSQAFMPRGAGEFCVVVAGGTDAPEPGSVRAFVTSPGQGVNIRRNVWHHPLIALGGESEFWVADWVGESANLQEHDLEGEEIVIER